MKRVNFCLGSSPQKTKIFENLFEKNIKKMTRLSFTLIVIVYNTDKKLFNVLSINEYYKTFPFEQLI